MSGVGSAVKNTWLFVIVITVIWFFKTGLFCVDLAVLELAL